MSEQIGTLVVVVLKAKDLVDKRTIGKQDPWAQIALAGKTHRTQVDIKGGQHPLWDEEFRLPVYKEDTEKNRTLELSCYSKEPRNDDLLGKGKINITETLRSGEFDDWVKLDINGVQRGEMYLEMTFFAAGPAPLNRRPTKMKQSDRMWRPPQTLSELPPATPPKSTSSSPSRTPGGSPRYNANTLSPAIPTPGHLAPPQAPSPYGSRTSSPRIPPADSPSVDFIPPLLRPGNLNSPPQPLSSAKPLPPTDPLRAVRPDAFSSSPPVSASSYPPLGPIRSSPPVQASPFPSYESALGFSPLPPSLQPAGFSPRQSFTQSRPPASAPVYGADAGAAYTQARASTGSNPNQSPYQSPGQTMYSPSTDRPSGVPGFPMAMPAAPAYDYTYSGPAYTSPAAAPYPSEPELPDPFANPRYKQTLPVPASVRSTLGFADESQVRTPRAEVQPQHQPAEPQHLRRDDRAGYSSGRVKSAAERDAEAARELQKRERAAEERRKEQEEKDLELARELDRVLNAPEERPANDVRGRSNSRTNHMPGDYQW